MIKNIPFALNEQKQTDPKDKRIFEQDQDTVFLLNICLRWLNEGKNLTIYLTGVKIYHSRSM